MITLTFLVHVLQEFGLLPSALQMFLGVPRSVSPMFPYKSSCHLVVCPAHVEGGALPSQPAFHPSCMCTSQAVGMVLPHLSCWGWGYQLVQARISQLQHCGTFWAGWFLVGSGEWGCSVPCRLFSSISGLYPLDASHAHSPIGSACFQASPNDFWQA